MIASYLLERCRNRSVDAANLALASAPIGRMGEDAPSMGIDRDRPMRSPPVVPLSENI